AMGRILVLPRFPQRCIPPPGQSSEGQGRSALATHAPGMSEATPNAPNRVFNPSPPRRFREKMRRFSFASYRGGRTFLSAPILGGLENSPSSQLRRCQIGTLFAITCEPLGVISVH